MNKIKVVCSDLDGTMLDDQKQLSRDNVTAILHWQHNGGLFGVTSGRQISGIKRAIKNCIQPDFVVCLNGAYVRSSKGKVFFTRIANPIAKRVLYLIAKYSVDCISITHAGKSRNIKPNNLAQALAKLNTSTPYFEKIAVVLHDGDKQINCLIMQLSMLPVEVTWSDVSFVEVVSKGVSKRSGVRCALPSNYRLEEVAAIGDYNNDIDIVSHVGLGAAVANAVIPLKKQATFITPDNNHSAVAALIAYINHRDNK